MLFRKNIKMLTVVLCITTIFFLLSGVGFCLIFKHKNQFSEFKGSLCKHGYPDRWRGACICDNPLMYSGRYCSERAVKNCKTNSDCPKNHYCLTKDNQGSCYKATTGGILNSETADFALSYPILSYYNSEAFCSALGSGYRPASRADFNCQADGVSCLNRQTVINLQEKYGVIGFFWLDEKHDSERAYYADINDGIVYNMPKDNFKVAQTLCVREKK